MKHNWKHAPAESKALWTCSECRKLDKNAIPDTLEDCGYYSKHHYSEAKQYLKEHKANEINRTESDTWAFVLYKLDNGEEWEEQYSKLEAPEDAYSLGRVKR